jgi:hypothetical protein
MFRKAIVALLLILVLLSVTSPRCAVGFSLHPIAIGSGLKRSAVAAIEGSIAWCPD